MNRTAVFVSMLACSFGSVICTQMFEKVIHSSTDVLLVGQVEGYKDSGAFPVSIKMVDPVSKETIFKERSLVDITNGKYELLMKDVKLTSGGTYEVEMDGLDAADEFEMAGFVNLQDSTPGAVQTGHLNISGYVLAGRIGLGVSPTIARVQVNESGTAQGVRSITNTGTAIYGQATAGTGLAAGGYFTTSSVGGRAMVGDALSTTGSTVGGLFYNRSTAGVAIWGRHINPAGASIGVYGQTASSSGTAIVAENTNTGDQALLAGNGTSLLTIGNMPKHRYEGTNAATMIPIAYGVIGIGGVAFSGSGNWTSTRISAGVFEVDVHGIAASFDSLVVIAMPQQSNGKEFCSYTPAFSGGDFRINTYNLDSSLLADSALSFVVYQPASYLPPALPPAAKRFVDMEAWAKADPVGYEQYRQENLAREKAAMRLDLAPLPKDESVEGQAWPVRPKR